VVERGASLTAVARALEREGLVRDARAVTWLARVRGVATSLRAGEYLQHNGFIGDYGIGAISGAALRVVVTDAPPETVSGGVLATVSEVNGAALDGTNDGRLLPAEVVTASSPP